MLNTEVGDEEVQAAAKSMLQLKQLVSSAADGAGKHILLQVTSICFHGSRDPHIDLKMFQAMGRPLVLGRSMTSTKDL